MSAARSSATSPSPNGQPRTRRPRHHRDSRWSPDRDDHLIFQWVKMEGKTQGWAASQLGISQATVSRIVQRYERWQAHALEREGGRLDPSERLRAQRWLTFERNELILASCLRIAGEMEGLANLSKSIIYRDAERDGEVRAEHTTIDRSGVAARFLRLAFRINMEQLKLAQLEEPPPSEPLSAEEIANLERQAAADTQEIVEARRRTVEEFDAAQRKQQEQEDESERLRRIEQAERLELAKELEQREQTQPENGQHPAEQPAAASVAEALLHNVHNENASEIGATAAEPCPCAPPPRNRKKSNPSCITDHDKAPWPSHQPEAQARESADDTPKRATRRRPTAAAR